MNASTFKATFLPCSRRMFNVAWRLTGNQQEAEDLVQEALLKLWTKRDNLPPIDNPAAYACTIVSRIFLDQQRLAHLQMVSNSPDNLPLMSDENLIQRIENRDVAQKVMQRIEQLPPEQRDIIILRDIDGMDFTEIAQKTGHSEGNTRVILSRARKAVRQLFCPSSTPPSNR